MTRPKPDHSAQLDPDAPLPDLTTVPVRPWSNDSRVGVPLWIVAVLIGIAVVKRWGAGSPGPILRPIALAQTADPATPAPTEDRTANGLASDFCLGAGVWQVASLERWQTQDVRVWRVIEPMADATGPADPAIPSVPIVALGVAALGWCAPAYGPARPAGPATITAWYVRDAIATEHRLRQVRPADGVTQLGALYLPLTACPEQTICAPLLRDPVPGPWVTGRVVFRYVDEGAGATAWLAADVMILPPVDGPATNPSAVP